MSNPAPPPFPEANSAVRTYVRAGVLLIPTIVVWLFAVTFLVPKLEQIWQDGGLTGSKAQWIMDASVALEHNFYFVIVGTAASLLLLEFRWSAWPRYRRTVVDCATLFFHTAILIGLTTIATAALVAAPMLARHK